jgi:hypothetical protein
VVVEHKFGTARRGTLKHCASKDGPIDYFQPGARKQSVPQLFSRLFNCRIGCGPSKSQLRCLLNPPSRNS